MAREEYCKPEARIINNDVTDLLSMTAGIYKVATLADSGLFRGLQRFFVLIHPTWEGWHIVSLFCPSDDESIVIVPVGQVHEIFPLSRIITGCKDEYDNQNFSICFAIAQFAGDKIKIEPQSMLSEQQSEQFIPNRYQEIGEIVFEQFLKGADCKLKKFNAHTAFTPCTEFYNDVAPF